MEEKELINLFGDRLGDLVSKWTIQHGLNKEQQCSAMGIPSSTLGSYIRNGENGRKASIVNLQVIAEYYGVSSDYLIGLTNDPNKKPSAVDDLGLSAKAIDRITQLDKNSKLALSTLLDTPQFCRALSPMCLLASVIEGENKRLDDYEPSSTIAEVDLPSNVKASVEDSLIAKELTNKIHKEYPEKYDRFYVASIKTLIHNQISATMDMLRDAVYELTAYDEYKKRL